MKKSEPRACRADNLVLHFFYACLGYWRQKIAPEGDFLPFQTRRLQKVERMGSSRNKQLNSDLDIIKNVVHPILPVWNAIADNIEA